MRRVAMVCLALLLCEPSFGATKRKKAKGEGTRSRIEQRVPDLDPAVINNAQMQEALAPNSRGPLVLRAQILLDRAQFSPGEIDGHFGDNMRRALAAFQGSRGLQPSGTFTPETWAALNADTAPAVVPYRLTAEDVNGPFAKIPADMMEKSKLKELGYQSTLEALGERFHSSPGLLTRLNKNVKFDAADVEIMVPSVQSPPITLKAAEVHVSKSDSSVSAMDASGKVMARFPASSGSEHDPLPIGKWKIRGVAKNPPFHYNPQLFWDADPNHSKAKIAPGPNNPVGVVWIDLSKEHYGIHGTPEPSKIGYTQSHGCIRLTNWDAMKLADMVSPNTPAILKE